MRKIILLIVFIIFLIIKFRKILIADNKNKLKNNSKALNDIKIWMRYDETKCDNPWNLDWLKDPSELEILVAVREFLIDHKFKILEIKSATQKDFITGEDCSSLNGRYYYVHVNASETEKLKLLNFYKVDKVPDKNNNDQNL